MPTPTPPRPAHPGDPIPWTVMRRWRRIWKATGQPCAPRHFRKLARQLGYSGHPGPIVEPAGPVKPR